MKRKEFLEYLDREEKKGKQIAPTKHNSIISFVSNSVSIFQLFLANIQKILNKNSLFENFVISLPALTNKLR